MVRSPSSESASAPVAQRRGLSVRELARRLAVSPSLISQIERGKATPSVATLYAITTELKLSLDELFAGAPAADAVARPRPRPGTPDAPDVAGGLKLLDAARMAAHPPPTAASWAPGDRTVIQLGSGVRWERLTHASDIAVDFLYVVYAPGGASCEPGALMRHAGREYGHVLSGTLEVTVGLRGPPARPRRLDLVRVDDAPSARHPR